MPKLLSSQVIEELKQLWSSNPQLTGKEIHLKLASQFGDSAISLRKVQQLISAAKRNNSWSEFQQWFPWKNPSETPEDTFFLMELQAARMRYGAENFKCHEAMWALRLRPMRHSSRDWAFLVVLELYIERHELNERWPEYGRKTEDLDAILISNPSAGIDSMRRYVEAMAQGKLPDLKTMRLTRWTTDSSDGQKTLEIWRVGFDALLIEFALAKQRAHSIAISLDLMVEMEAEVQWAKDNYPDEEVMFQSLGLKQLEHLLKMIFGEDQVSSKSVNAIYVANNRIGDPKRNQTEGAI